jgi:Prp8 binding protein
MPQTAVQFSLDGSTLFTSSLSGQIIAQDLRTDSVQYTLDAHIDTVTGLKLAPGGERLLSNSMDNTVRVWDVRAYNVGGRMKASFEGKLLELSSEARERASNEAREDSNERSERKRIY